MLSRVATETMLTLPIGTPQVSASERCTWGRERPRGSGVGA